MPEAHDKWLQHVKSEPQMGENLGHGGVHDGSMPSDEGSGCAGQACILKASGEFLRSSAR